MDGLRGLGGAGERGAAGASAGSALSGASGYGAGRRPCPGGWTRIARAGRGGCRARVGGHGAPARPRGCSTPARNGAAERRASALYIAGGAELRRSCAPPCSAAPPPPLRVLARSRASGNRREGAGPPGRGSLAYWSARDDVTGSQFQGGEGQADECRREPRRRARRGGPAVSPSDGEAGRRRRHLLGACHRPSPPPGFDGAFRGWRAGRAARRFSIGGAQGAGPGRAGGRAGGRGRGSWLQGRRSGDSETRKTDAILGAAACWSLRGSPATPSVAGLPDPLHVTRERTRGQPCSPNLSNLTTKRATLCPKKTHHTLHPSDARPPSVRVSRPGATPCPPAHSPGALHRTRRTSLRPTDPPLQASRASGRGEGAQRAAPPPQVARRSTPPPPPPPSGRPSSPRSASSIGQRQGGGRAEGEEAAAALLCSPPPSLPSPRGRTPPRRGGSHFGSRLSPPPPTVSGLWKPDFVLDPPTGSQGQMAKATVGPPPQHTRAWPPAPSPSSEGVCARLGDRSRRGAHRRRATGLRLRRAWVLGLPPGDPPSTLALEPRSPHTC